MNRFRRGGVGRQAMADHFHRFAFGDLEKAGGLARGGAMHVEHVEGRGFSLRREFRRAVGQAPQIVHLLAGEQEGWNRSSLRRPVTVRTLDETAAQFEDVEFVAMLHGRDRRGFGGQVFPQIERDRANVGDAGRRLLGRSGGAGGEKETKENENTRTKGSAFIGVHQRPERGF